MNLRVGLLFGKTAKMSDTGDQDKDIERYINESPELAEARAAGVDLWALWANLHRTPTERVRRHQIAIDLMRKLQKAKKK